MSVRSNKYFVILHDHHGGAVAMTGDDDGFQLALFATRDEAEAAGEGNIMGRACGFDIHELGGGCDAT